MFLDPQHSSVSVIWKSFPNPPLIADRCFKFVVLNQTTDWKYRGTMFMNVAQCVLQMTISDFVAHRWPCSLWAGTLPYIAYEKWACCQIQSSFCIYPDKSSVKGKTVSMFKGHALMVTLPQAHTNRLCQSPSSVRVKGDTTWKYDAGDTFITGCALGQLLKRRTHFSTWRASKLSTSKHKFAVL